MKTSNEILNSINTFIEQLPYERKPFSLYEPIQYVLSLGGKRIRPALMLLTYQLYKDQPEDIMMPAVALETYHNYTLLHDDLMDNADLRRGHATVHKRWDANTAVLSGDSMLVLAYERMAQVPADKLVLLACAVKIGAILAGADEKDADNLYQYGEQLGLAFQLQDDLLDVYGDPAVFGKAIGGDITSNKKTYMLINAFLLADDRQRRELHRWVDAKEFDRQEKIAAVTKLYNEIGIRRLCEEKINSYFESAKQYLARIDVPLERKQPLIDFTNEMMNRNK